MPRRAQKIVQYLKSYESPFKIGNLVWCMPRDCLGRVIGHCEGNAWYVKILMTNDTVRLFSSQNLLLLRINQDV